MILQYSHYCYLVCSSIYIWLYTYIYIFHHYWIPIFDILFYITLFYINKFYVQIIFSCCFKYVFFHTYLIFTIYNIQLFSQYFFCILIFHVSSKKTYIHIIIGSFLRHIDLIYLYFIAFQRRCISKYIFNSSISSSCCKKLNIVM